MGLSIGLGQQILRCPCNGGMTCLSTDWSSIPLMKFLDAIDMGSGLLRSCMLLLGNRSQISREVNVVIYLRYMDITYILHYPKLSDLQSLPHCTASISYVFDPHFLCKTNID